MRARNYGEVQRYALDLRPFDHRSCWARYENQYVDGVLQSERHYVLYSYSTPILVVDTHGKRYRLNDHSYSVTTSRHQGIARQVVAMLRHADYAETGTLQMVGGRRYR